MSPLIKYKDYEYANTRLRGTVVFLGDEPVYIENVDEYGDFDGGTYHSWGYEELSGHVQNLDVNPRKLGLINGNRKTDYLTRKPLRYYKQGLVKGSIKSRKFNIDVNSFSFFEFLRNHYPNPVLAFRSVMLGDNFECAFCKELAFTHPIQNNSLGLIYQNIIVGHAIMNDWSDDINYHLNDEYRFLQETLGEHINV